MPKRKEARSTPTPASQSEKTESPMPVARIIPPAPKAVTVEPTAAATPPPAEAKAVEHRTVLAKLLCPQCRHPLTTYSTDRRGAVTVRYHRCGHCGATSLRTHETNGVVQFVGWASRSIPEMSLN